MKLTALSHSTLAVTGLLLPGMIMGLYGHQPGIQAFDYPRIERPAPRPTITPVPMPTLMPLVPMPSYGTNHAASQPCAQTYASLAARTLICLTAQVRQRSGLPVVTANNQLMAAASSKARDILSCGFTHTACGRQMDYWVEQQGYTGRCVGENLAMGQSTPQEAFNDWMNSVGHRDNILNRDFRSIGVAEVVGAQGPVWVMELGGC